MDMPVNTAPQQDNIIRQAIPTWGLVEDLLEIIYDLDSRINDLEDKIIELRTGAEESDG